MLNGPLKGKNTPHGIIFSLELKFLEVVEGFFFVVFFKLSFFFALSLFTFCKVIHIIIMWSLATIKITFIGSDLHSIFQWKKLRN